jgi:hypothetical protein
VRLLDREGNSINDWRAWTPPKKKKHWRAGRSAMELARAWFTSATPVVPNEIAALLDSRPETASAVIHEGWPELVTSLPESGEGRNHDLVVVGTAAGKSFLVAIETKVDEALGPSVQTYWKRSKAKDRSFAWRRIDKLVTSVFGPTASPNRKPWSTLRYQLLTAVVGTALEARSRKCETAALIFHEFVTESATSRGLTQNGTAFSALLSALGADGIASGVLYGPFQITVADMSRIPVFVGKAEYTWIRAKAQAKLSPCPCPHRALHLSATPIWSALRLGPDAMCVPIRWNECSWEPQDSRSSRALRSPSSRAVTITSRLHAPRTESPTPFTRRLSLHLGWHLMLT